MKERLVYKIKTARILKVKAARITVTGLYK